MKGLLWTLFILLCGGFHTTEGYGVEYSGGQEHGRTTTQIRNSRYVDGASGSWNTNVGYSSSKGNERGVLEGLLETSSGITSGVGGSSVAVKGGGNDRGRLKNSFQIKVETDTRDVRPTAILGDVVDKAVSAIGSISEIAKKNLETRRNFRGSFSLEGNSHLKNGQHFEAQDELIGTGRHGATASAKVVAVNSESSSNFDSPDEKKSGHILESIGEKGGIESGLLTYNSAVKSINSEQNLRTFVEKLTAGSGARSTFGTSGGTTTNFRDQFRRGDVSSPVIALTLGDRKVENEEGFNERDDGHVAISKTGHGFDVKNVNSDEHGGVSSNIDSDSLTSKIKQEVIVTAHTQGDAAETKNLRSVSQTSSIKGNSGNKKNFYNERSVLHEHIDFDDNTELEDHPDDQHVLRKDRFNIQTSRGTAVLRNKHSQDQLLIDNGSNENEDSFYAEEVDENKSAGFDEHHSEQNRIKTVQLIGSTDQGHYATLSNFRPDTDYDYSEEIKDSNSEELRTISGNSQINHARPIVQFQKEITGDNLNNHRQQELSGYGKSSSQGNIITNTGRSLESISQVRNLRNRGQEQAKLSGSKLIQTEPSIISHDVDDDDNDNDNSEEHNVGRSTILLQEYPSNRFTANQRNSFNKESDGSYGIESNIHIDDSINNEEIQKSNIGHTSQLLKENLSEQINPNQRNTFIKEHVESDDVGASGLVVIENGALKKSQANGVQTANKRFPEQLFGQHSDNIGSGKEYEHTVEVTNSGGIDDSKQLSAEHLQLALKGNQNEETVYVSNITPLKPEVVGITSGFEGIGDRPKNTQLYRDQVVRSGQNGNYGPNNEAINRKLKSTQELVINTEEPSETSYILVPDSERRIHLSPSSRKQYLESHGDTILEHTNVDHSLENRKLPYIPYSSLDKGYVTSEIRTPEFVNAQNPRHFSNYGKHSEYDHDIGERPHIVPVRPGTKIVRKKITETVHTTGGHPHLDDFGHGGSHRISIKNPHGQHEHGSIHESDIAHRLNHHIVHHRHHHNRGLLDGEHPNGFLHHYEVHGFGPEGHIDGEPPYHHGGRRFHGRHVSYPEDDGRVGFRKTVEVTHEVEEDPRLGRDRFFAHSQHY